MITIAPKHTPESPKLHSQYQKKNLQAACSRHPLATSPQRYVFQHLLFSKIISPMFEQRFRSSMYTVLKLIKCIIIKLLYNLQRYVNMDTAHRAGWGKWVFGIPALLHRYLVKYGADGVTFLTHIHINRCNSYLKLLTLLILTSC